MRINIDGVTDKVGSTPAPTLQHQGSKPYAHFHVSLQHEENSMSEGEKARQPTASEVHKKADESSQMFELWVTQPQNKKSILHDTASFSELKSACLGLLDDGDANFVGTPQRKLECRDTFNLSLRTPRSRTAGGKVKDDTKDKADDKNNNDLLGRYPQTGLE